MKIYYNAVNIGNWDDANTWQDGQKPTNQVTGIATISIPNGITVTIPENSEVTFGSGVLLQILGGTLTLDGKLTIVKKNMDLQFGNDHSIADHGKLNIGNNGVLDMTVEGNSYPFLGLIINNGSLTNNGNITVTCRTGTQPTIALATGIKNSGNLTNNGIITIDSPDNISNGGNGPSFGILNIDNGTIINSKNASIMAIPISGAIGGGIINNTSGSNFQNEGSFNFYSGQFWNAGSFSGTAAIGQCLLDPSSASSWDNSRIGPMSGNKNILVVNNNYNSWYVEASTVNSGIVLKKGGFVTCDDIASAGYEKNEFVAVGPQVNSENQNEIFKSTDGKNWNSVYQSARGSGSALNAVTFGTNSVIAVGNANNNGLYASSDESASSWETGTISDTILNEISYGDIGSGDVYNVYLATSDSATYRSKDGKSWTKKGDSSKSNICYSPTHKFFYGIEQNTGLVYRTGNGMWTTSIGKIWDASVETNFINDFIWSEEAQLFIAVGGEGSTPIDGELPSAIFTSADGITWSNNLYNEGKVLLKVAYGAGVFIAVGYNNTIIQIIT